MLTPGLIIAREHNIVRVTANPNSPRGHFLAPADCGFSRRNTG